MCVDIGISSYVRPLSPAGFCTLFVIVPCVTFPVIFAVILKATFYFRIFGLTMTLLRLTFYIEPNLCFSLSDETCAC